MTVRSGIGYDSHRLEPGRRLVLAGIEIEDAPNGLVGHSDADVAAHALIDALLGAVALGDIGQHFPDTDPAYRDADSMQLLEAVCARVGERGWKLVSADTTIICEAPKLGPYRDRMRARLAEVAGLAPEAVNVKFTTSEGMGAIGRGEGIAALAVATVERP